MFRVILTSSIAHAGISLRRRFPFLKGKTAAFIYTAAEKERNQRELEWLKNDRKGLIDAGVKVFDYTISDKSLNQIKRDLKKAEVIHVNGGNTTYLLKKAQESGFVFWIKEAIKAGKIYIGSSAGSIIAGPILPEYLYRENPDIKLNALRGFRLVNFTVVPHWGSKEFRTTYFKNNCQRLRLAYNQNLHPYILLSDLQYVYVEDNKIYLFSV